MYKANVANLAHEGYQDKPNFNGQHIFGTWTFILDKVFRANEGQS